MLLYGLAAQVMSEEVDNRTSHDTSGSLQPQLPTNESIEELTERDIEEKDDRPFFIRYVTPFVKTWGVLTIAG